MRSNIFLVVPVSGEAVLTHPILDSWLACQAGQGLSPTLRPHDVGGQTEQQLDDLRRQVAILEAEKNELAAELMEERTHRESTREASLSSLMMLSADERNQAQSLFDRALHRERSGWGTSDVPTEIDRRTFSELILELVAAGEGGSAPTEKELHDIFDAADADASGMVSESEFLELYAKVKAGQLSGKIGDLGKSLVAGASDLFSKSKSVMSDLHGQVKRW